MYGYSHNVSGGYNAMIRKLIVSDVESLRVQEKQEWYKPYIIDMAKCDGLQDAFSYVENGEVKAVVGMQPMWQGRAVVWALIGHIGNWVKFHKSIKRLMEDYAIKRGIIRLEMTTEIGFDESERWSQLLGFKYESTMRNFGVDGKDHKMWVRLWQQQSRG